MLTQISKVQRVLVLDGDPRILAQLDQQLGKNGTTIDTAESVAAASWLMSSGSYDLAIMNLGRKEDCALAKIAVSKGIPNKSGRDGGGDTAGRARLPPYGTLRARRAVPSMSYQLAVSPEAGLDSEDLRSV